MNSHGHASRPNVMIVLIDTLRADHLSCYGHGRRTSPCLDRIAEQGTVYEKAISAAAWTPPSHASIFTGTHCSRHGVDRTHLLLDPALTPLPEALRRHGYRTYGVSSNYWLSRETRFDRGFDEFVHSWQVVQTRGSNTALERQNRKSALALDTLHPGANGHGVHGWQAWMDRVGGVANDAFERATKRLRRDYAAYDDGAWRVNSTVKRWIHQWRSASTPFFAFVHYMEPHIRYAAPLQYRTMHLPAGVSRERADRVNQDPWKFLCGEAPMGEEDFAILSGLYDGEISYVDHRVGELITSLEQAGILDDTLLIITSDHGENLGDHGLMDHAYCLYDTLLHVPLIVRWPTTFARNARISEVVSTVDLFPTILEAAAIRDDSSQEQVQGRSLLGASGNGGLGQPVFAEYLDRQPPIEVLKKRFPGFDGERYDRTLRSVRTGTHKYIWASDGGHELFDLARDPRESRNVITDQPDAAARLDAELARWLGSFAHAGPSEDSIELDDEMRRRLEDLGYLS